MEKLTLLINDKQTLILVMKLLNVTYMVKCD